MSLFLMPYIASFLAVSHTPFLPALPSLVSFSQLPLNVSGTDALGHMKQSFSLQFTFLFVKSCDFDLRTKAVLLSLSLFPLLIDSA